MFSSAALLLHLVACGGETPAPAAPAAPAEAPVPEAAAPAAAPAPAAAAASHWPAPLTETYYSCTREQQGWCVELGMTWLQNEAGVTSDKSICDMNGGTWAKDTPCKRDALEVACSDPKKQSFYAFTAAGAEEVRKLCITGTIVEKPA